MRLLGSQVGSTLADKLQAAFIFEAAGFPVCLLVQ